MPLPPETYGAILHDIANCVQALRDSGKEPNRYHLGQVELYATQLKTEISPTLATLATGMLYHHLDKIGRQK